MLMQMDVWCRNVMSTCESKNVDANVHAWMWVNASMWMDVWVNGISEHMYSYVCTFAKKSPSSVHVCETMDGWNLWQCRPWAPSFVLIWEIAIWLPIHNLHMKMILNWWFDLHMKHGMKLHTHVFLSKIITFCRTGSFLNLWKWSIHVFGCALFSIQDFF